MVETKKEKYKMTLGIAEVENASRILVEQGGCLTVSEDATIVMVDGTPVTTSKKKPLKIPHQGMKDTDCTILNPFSSSCVQEDQRLWFWKQKSVQLGFLIRNIVRKIVDINTGKEEGPEEAASIVGLFKDQVDTKVENEIKQIKATKLLNIYWDKKAHKAQLQTDITDEEFRKSLGTKVRKKTWTFLENLFEAMFETVDLHRVFQHESEMAQVLEIEGRLTILAQASAAMNDWTTRLLEIDMMPEKLFEIRDQLPEFRKATVWLASSTEKVTQDDNSESCFTLPNGSQVQSNVVPHQTPMQQGPVTGPQQAWGGPPPPQQPQQSQGLALAGNVPRQQQQQQPQQFVGPDGVTYVQYPGYPPQPMQQQRQPMQQQRQPMQQQQPMYQQPTYQQPVYQQQQQPVYQQQPMYQQPQQPGMRPAIAPTSYNPNIASYAPASQEPAHQDTSPIGLDQ